MTLRPILFVPDPLLLKTSHFVEKIDETLLSLIHDMFETMYAAPGIGLAAVQIGVPLQVFVLDIAKNEKKEPHCFINPEIIWRSEQKNVYEEGCLSIPDVYAKIERPKEICVRYLTCDGTEKILEADGLLATCIQHEIDHLNGILFINYLSQLKQDMIIRKFTKKTKEFRKKHKKGV